MVTTNVDFGKYLDFQLSEKRFVDVMLKVLDLMRDYVGYTSRDKIDIIIQLFQGQVLTAE